MNDLWVRPTQDALWQLEAGPKNLAEAGRAEDEHESSLLAQDFTPKVFGFPELLLTAISLKTRFLRLGR